MLLVMFRLLRVFESTLSAGTMVMALLFLDITDLQLMGTFMAMLLLGQMGINAWNDSLDVVEDSVAHPERPIPSGEISVYQARIVGTILLLGSISVGIFFSFFVVVMILVGISIGITYSFVAKPVFLLKNTVVSVSVLLFLLILPSALQTSFTTIYSGFVISLVLLLQGYEVLKDLRDIPGDRQAGYNTLPIKLGIRVTTALTAALFGVSCLIISIFFLFLQRIPEAIISAITVPIIMAPLIWFINNYSIQKADYIRYITVIILFISLTSIGYITLINAGIF